MSDLIDRQAVLKQLKGCLTGGETEYQYVKLHIDSIPPVNPQEPKTGHWISGICDNCEYDWGKDAPIASVPNFCPNCGCRMFVPQESEE